MFTRSCVLSLAVLILFGCSRPGSPSSAVPPSDSKGLEQAERQAASLKPSTDARSRPIAVAGGERVDWDDLRAALSEAQGAIVLEEAVLDRLLARELASAGLRITSAEVDGERALLAQSMTQDAGISPTAAADVLDDLRTRRGLGPTRFDSLLRRNAALRRLVRDSVSVSNPEIEAALAARYAERVNTRIIVVRTEREASNLRSQLKDVPGSITVLFAQLAMQHSLDASAPRGGLLDPFSLEDATYPIALRQALQSLAPGDSITPSIALDGGYAIVLLEGRSPSPYAKRPGDESMIEQQIRLRKERIAMDQLARRLLDAAGVTVFDESLAWSWSRRPR